MSAQQIEISDADSDSDVEIIKVVAPPLPPAPGASAKPKASKAAASTTSKTAEGLIDLTGGAAGAPAAPAKKAPPAAPAQAPPPPAAAKAGRSIADIAASQEKESAAAMGVPSITSGIAANADMCDNLEELGSTYGTMVAARDQRMTSDAKIEEDRQARRKRKREQAADDESDKEFDATDDKRGQLASTAERRALHGARTLKHVARTLGVSTRVLTTLFSGTADSPTGVGHYVLEKKGKVLGKGTALCVQSFCEVMGKDRGCNMLESFRDGGFSGTIEFPGGEKLKFHKNNKSTAVDSLVKEKLVVKGLIKG